MLHRLPHAEPGRRPVLNEIQPDLNPLEILFDVRKLMTVAYVCQNSFFAWFPSEVFLGATSQCFI